MVTSVKKRVFGLLAVLLLSSVAIGAAPASAGSGFLRPDDIVGSWLTTVTVTGNPAPHQIIINFEPDHRLTSTGAPGFPNLKAKGLWTSGYGGRFSFWISHEGLNDENGNQIAFPVNAVHSGVFGRRGFATNAFAYAVAPGDAWLGPVTVSTRAERM